MKICSSRIHRQAIILQKDAKLLQRKPNAVSWKATHPTGLTLLPYVVEQRNVETVDIARKFEVPGEVAVHEIDVAERVVQVAVRFFRASQRGQNITGQSLGIEPVKYSHAGGNQFCG